MQICLLVREANGVVVVVKEIYFYLLIIYTNIIKTVQSEENVAFVYLLTYTS